jgi:flagellar FliL protein
MAKPAKPIPAAAESAPKPKNPKMMVIIIAVLVLIIAGGAGWYFTRGNQHEAQQEAKADKPMEPKFVALEPFTVNLQHEEGDQFLQIGITLKVSAPELEEKIKVHLPEIRSRLLLLLSSKRASELTPAEGKKKLTQEVIAETEAVLGLRAASAPAEAAQDGIDVLFTSFIIQ